MALVDIINSWIGPIAGVIIGKVLPQQQAYQLADVLTRRISKDPDSEVMRSLRHNQKLIRGEETTEEELVHAARMVLQNVGRGYADWYKAVSETQQDLIDRCSIDDEIFDAIEESRREKRGLVFVGPHMSSFNMFILGLGARKVSGQVLSYPDPRPGYRVDNAIRKRFGLDITPISIGSLRQAFDNLRSGGFVLTAVDRPDVGGEMMTFFGKRVRLPVGHARLAVKTGSRLLVGTCQMVKPGSYHVKAKTIDTRPATGEPPTAIEVAQRVLRLIEGYILERPEDWMMFLPIKESGDPVQAG
ncbi:MAG: lysophospholipid acyltransferase family protein [Anaerolineales bacterium]|nr:lysophospholipid acyltransferase family protein [Anaerolineales bacterium]